MRRILYTRHDGGVSICQPAPDVLAWLSCGGYWSGRGIDLDEQIEKTVLAAGHRYHAAARFVRAMDRGGCTTPEAYDIIRDRDCGHLGSAFEIISPDDLPDRWFRDAWRRSHNGGPICIDLKAARRIQFRRIKSAADRENKRRSAEVELFDRPIILSLGTIRDLLHKAESVDDLRRIWPNELCA